MLCPHCGTKNVYQIDERRKEKTNYTQEENDRFETLKQSLSEEDARHVSKRIFIETGNVKYPLIYILRKKREKALCENSGHYLVETR